MRTKNTFSILFWIHPTRVKNNQTSIFTRITVNGKRANISLKLQIGVGLWDSNKQRAKGTSDEVS
jgi:integrase/recombinase XerD